MVDRLALNPNEIVMLDTTNNTVSIVLVSSGNVEIRDPNNNIFAYLQAQYEIFTLAIGTGIYTAKNIGTSACNILIIREFIY
jgi:hypothetical protein